MERTILDKRTLGCICDHGTTECKDIVSLCDAHRGYCGVYVCNKGLQEILRLTALNDGATTRFFGLRPLNDGSGLQEILRLTALNDVQSMAVSKVHISSLYVIGKMSEGQMGESSKYFTPPAPLNNRGEDFSYIHLTTRFFGLRPLNDAMNCYCERSEAIQFLGRGMRILTGLPRKSDDFLAMTDNRNITKPMRNEQNGLVVMFSSAKYHKAQETKPDRCRNMIKKMRNEQNGLVVMFSSAKHHKAQETKPDRCRNMIKKMHNDQNGLVVMFSSAKHHKAQETKPETDRNQIQNKLWQKQSNRNISTCVAQREVA